MKLDKCVRWPARWLRAGAKAGCRRRVLASVLGSIKAHLTVFYTVQSPADAQRLRSTGDPWPTNGDRIRAYLGPGVYAWKHPSEAREYRIKLADPGLLILRFCVLSCRLAQFRKFDVDSLEDDALDSWLTRYAPGYPEHPVGISPHGMHYIRRGTNLRDEPDLATEHYFHESVFKYLWFS